MPVARKDVWPDPDRMMAGRLAAPRTLSGYG